MTIDGILKDLFEFISRNFGKRIHIDVHTFGAGGANTNSMKFERLYCADKKTTNYGNLKI